MVKVFERDNKGKRIVKEVPTTEEMLTVIRKELDKTNNGNGNNGKGNGNVK